jgi:hypothetical protein
MVSTNRVRFLAVPRWMDEGRHLIHSDENCPGLCEPSTVHVRS